MIREALIYIAATLITVWLIVVVPMWLLGMAYVGEFRLLPDGPPDTGFWLIVAAFYLPPAVSAAIGLWLLKSKNRMNDA